MPPVHCGGENLMLECTEGMNPAGGSKDPAQSTQSSGTVEREHEEKEYLEVLSEVLKSDADLSSPITELYLQLDMAAKDIVRQDVAEELGDPAGVKGETLEDLFQSMESGLPSPSAQNEPGEEGREAEADEEEGSKAKSGARETGTGNNRTCHICDKWFRYPYLLKIHMVSHSDEKKHVCSYCNFKCKWRSSMTYHMAKLHRDEGPLHEGSGS